MKTYATLGPACCDEATLAAMLRLGINGFRLNLSHCTLPERRPWTDALQRAAASVGVRPELIIDMRGPEMRLGVLPQPIDLHTGDDLTFGAGGVALDDDILVALKPGQEILVDDGAVVLEVQDREEHSVLCLCTQGGTIESRKSLTLPGVQLCRSAVSPADIADLAVAERHGVTAVMQPFVRSRRDLLELRQALEAQGLSHLRIFAKVEDAQGIETLPEWMDLCDVVTIARGDLGSNLPLWELPRAQKRIAAACRAAGHDFLVVTHLLQSMIHHPVPTRAEVTDIYNACLDGASALMLTGETAQGAYPLAAAEMLLRVAACGEQDR